MEAIAPAGAAEFLDLAGPLLTADEARSNLILGIAGVLRDRPEVYPEFGLWVVADGGAPVAAALVTPPHNLILADAATDRILGVHMVGPRVSELIAEAAVAIELAASAEDLARTSHAHPTLSEVVREAALAVDKRALHS